LFVWHIVVTAGRHRAEYISGESINRARWMDGWMDGMAQHSKGHISYASNE
jgi:hypothetical protein